MPTKAENEINARQDLAIAEADAKSLERIKRLDRRTKPLLLCLLAALAVAGTGLIYFEDAYFFSYGRAIKLPFVSIAIPTIHFFVIGATLAASLYVYLQIHLLKLSNELGRISPRPAGRMLSKSFDAGAITDTMIYYRNGMRRDNSAKLLPGPGLGSEFLHFNFIWLGVLVQLFFWWFSMAAHVVWLTLWLGVLCIVVIHTTLHFILTTYRELGNQSGNRLKWGLLCINLLAVLIIPPLSYLRTTNDFNTIHLARANMYDVDLVPQPEGWPWRERDSREKFSRDWCQEKFAPNTSLAGMPNKYLPISCRGISQNQITELRIEWQAHRQSLLNQIPQLDLQNRDLRRADMRAIFLPNANLRNAMMTEVELAHAYMEGVILNGAQMAAADLGYANIQGADFSDAYMQGVDLSNANLEETSFREADMHGSLLTGWSYGAGPIINTNFTKADTKWIAVQAIDISEAIIEPAQIKQMFGDASVALPKEMQERPCHWSNEILSNNISRSWQTRSPNDIFIGHWRGWVEANGGDWPTSSQFNKFKPVPPIPPPPECPLIKDM